MNLLEIIELGNGSFCLLDIETTGFSPTSEEITEIAAIRVNRDFEVVAEISRLVRIERRVPWYITQLNGITDSLLASEGGPLPVALQDVHEFLGGQPTFAHNARFDRSFLNAAVRREELMIHFPLECSIPISNDCCRVVEVMAWKLWRNR